MARISINQERPPLYSSWLLLSQTNISDYPQLLILAQGPNERGAFQHIQSRRAKARLNVNAGRADLN